MPCTNNRRWEGKEGRPEKGQTLEWSWEGKGSEKLLKECVGVCTWTCMDTRASPCLLGMASEAGMQGMGWYLEEEEWNPGSVGCVL